MWNTRTESKNFEKQQRYLNESWLSSLKFRIHLFSITNTETEISLAM